ncbi:cyclic di-GMP phosphodiesterase CdgJ [Rhodoferax lithotrophicus]|uniref:Cyclic di-GMP phosphodiesterase CdgJ n=1 Tax=Rhodoferax lithotrophicus TaxID=2798804 RepID=A0ABM7MLE9_9BURK|nr:HDOD domain-containing protein [Rhodoferax sp. MIZ03]BCO27064.1 cyclic di-GMP phosphodiesterase CdgJ [Rhodoferax sp. MIZ03]
MNTPILSDIPASDLAILTIARQPVLDAKHSVVGYELFDRSIKRQDFTAASDAALLFNLLSSADSEVLSGHKLIFINCTHQTLAAGHLELIEPERVVLEIPPMPLDQSEPEDIETYRQILANVHQRGFKLAFDETVLTPAYSTWLTLASFIKLDVSRLEVAQLKAIVAQANQSTSAKLVAEKVETAEQFEHANTLGFHLFQGYWFAKPVLIKGQTIRPAQAVIIQLINLVRKQASTTEIEEVLKHDPTLSFNLLRFINSAGFGLSCEVTSFKHAVMILGLKKLFRWAALLMTSASVGASSPAVGSAAVVRGRLMELLAAELLSPEECDNAFVVGIFSLLDTMMGIPLAEALASISLPQTVTDALLYNKGLLAPFLQLTLACESADDTAFAETAMALQLTGDQVNWAHLQALAWAENMTR